MRFTPLLLLLLLFAVSTLASLPPIIWGPPCVRLDEGEGVPRLPNFALRNPTKPEVVEEGERFVLNASRVTYDQAERYLARAIRVADSGKEGLRRCKEAIEKGETAADEARRERTEKKKEMNRLMNEAAKKEVAWVAVNDLTRGPLHAFKIKVKEFYEPNGLVEEYAAQRKEYDDTLRVIQEMEPFEEELAKMKQRLDHARREKKDFDKAIGDYEGVYNDDNAAPAKAKQAEISALYMGPKGCREGTTRTHMRDCYQKEYEEANAGLFADETRLLDKTNTLVATRNNFKVAMRNSLEATRKKYLEKEFELWEEDFKLEKSIDTANAAKTGAMKDARDAADQAKLKWEEAERKYADLNFDLMKEKYKIELIRHERELMQVDQCRALFDLKKKQRAAGYSETNPNFIFLYMAAAGATFAALLFPIYFFNIWPFREGSKKQKAEILAEVQIPLKPRDFAKHFEPWHVWRHTHFDEKSLTYRYEGIDADINAYGIDGYPTPEPPTLAQYLPNTTIKKTILPRPRPPKKPAPKEKKVPSKMHWKHAKKHAKCAKTHLRCKARTAQMAALIDRATRLGEGYAPAPIPTRDVRKSRKVEAEEKPENPKAPDVQAPDEDKEQPAPDAPRSLMKDEDKTQVTGTLEAPIVDELMLVQKPPKSASSQVKSGPKKPEPEPLFKLAKIAHGDEEKTQAQTIAQPPASAEKTQAQTIVQQPADGEKTQVQTIAQPPASAEKTQMQTIAQPVDGKNKDKSDRTQASVLAPTKKPSLPRDEKKPAP